MKKLPTLTEALANAKPGDTLVEGVDFPYKPLQSPDKIITNELNGNFSIRVDKRSHRLRLLNETESSVDVVIEKIEV
jgi:hypothetical protein